MKRTQHSAQFKAMAMQKLLGSGRSVREVAEDLGLAPSQLYRWRRGEGMHGPMVTKSPGKEEDRRPQDWTGEERLAAVIEAGSLGEEELGGFLRRRGLHRQTLEQWRKAALAGMEGKPTARRPTRSKEDTKRIRQLERELLRKDKALAETAALLVLKKKVDAIWGDEEDDTTPRSGR